MPGGYLREILNAKVYDVAVETPLDRANKLSERSGNDILLKREDLQVRTPARPGAPVPRVRLPTPPPGQSCCVGRRAAAPAPGRRPRQRRTSADALRALLLRRVPHSPPPCIAPLPALPCSQ